MLKHMPFVNHSLGVAGSDFSGLTLARHMAGGAGSTGASVSRDDDVALHDFAVRGETVKSVVYRMDENRYTHS